MVVVTELFGRFLRMVRGVQVMAVTEVGVVRRFLVCAIAVVFGSFVVMLGSQRMVLGGFLVTLSDGMR